MKTRIVVSLAVEGIHQWKDCNVPGVEFLKTPHRHIFYIVAKKCVEGLDREIEIIKFKREISKYLGGMYGSPAQFGNNSCEMIAKAILEEFGLDYCSVLEDNENGAEVFV